MKRQERLGHDIITKDRIYKISYPIHNIPEIQSVTKYGVPVAIQDVVHKKNKTNTKK